jgi:nucleotide-binding universal stress UspA family protein
MLPIRTILHPTDFSAPSAAAFQVACALARDYGARLVLLYVKPPDIVYGDGFILPPDPEPVRRELFDKLKALGPADPALRVERVLLEGDPAAGIVEKARELPCDVIVMGTHGRTGVGRLLLGSVAEVVLRRAPCPVLTVKGLPALVPPVEAATREALTC